MLRNRVGWVVGILAGALLVSLIALAVLVHRVSVLPPLPTSILLPVVVEVTEEGFLPSVVIVQPGAEVRWVFKGGRHSIADLAGEWESGSKEEGLFIRSMPTAGGTISFLDYECKVHGRRGSVHLLPEPIRASSGGV